MGRAATQVGQGEKKRVSVIRAAKRGRRDMSTEVDCQLGQANDWGHISPSPFRPLR